jgi:hypothetical protein
MKANLRIGVFQGFIGVIAFIAYALPPVKSFNEVTEMGIVGSRKKVTERAGLFLLVVV